MTSGQMIDIQAKDGFTLGAWHAPAQGERKGGLVVIQEIFGITPHIRDVCDGFAADGFEVLAPALFDRTERGFTAEFTAEGFERARKAAGAVEWDKVVMDVQACVDRLKDAGPVFIVGYCFGGAVVWVAACRVEGLAAASGYYGRLIVDFLDETPRCPIILHFGETDPSIPMENVKRISEAHPDIPVHVYPAGHGFNSDRPELHHEESARLARQRTLDLFRAHMG